MSQTSSSPTAPPALRPSLAAPFSGLCGLIGGNSTRARRMTILIFGIIALSFADLLVTITHLRTIGMIEANPIAAYLIERHGSIWVLSAYKLATMSVCVVILIYIRRYVLGEFAAWTSIAILAGMSVVWHLYATELDQPDSIQLVEAAQMDARWLFLD
jgi:hypothetical protein